MVKCDAQSIERHSRPRRLDGDSAVIYNLVTASWGNEDQIPYTLLRNINIERCSAQLVKGDYVVFKIDLVT